MRRKTLGQAGPAGLAVSFAAVLAGSPALAEGPSVVADIGPVHGLVKMVTGDNNDTTLLLPPGTSPHGFALRPSQAGALQSAGLIVWVGPELTPSLGRSIENLANGAAVLELSAAEGIETLPFRGASTLRKLAKEAEAARMAAEKDHDDHAGHDHDDHKDQDDHAGHDHDEHKDHDDHAGHDHDEHKDHDDHAGHDHDDHKDHDDHDHAHDHGDMDPHLWLSPLNAQVWLGEIAEALAAQDPANADLYRANAKAGQAEIADALAEAKALLAPLAGKKLAVYHDAYQYFEANFDLSVVGTLSDSDATAPGVSHVDQLRTELAEEPPVCMISEPGATIGLIQAVLPSDVAVVEVDPLGRDLPQGAPLYPAMIRSMAEKIAGCAAK
ncbi:MAG: zinc ABC transporter substrate-binding protein [Pelagimonas sp.]|jgi:zinc transport system substrate-binding protein|nr:zinc ABC transporter substrate-binding protein [Pelagimonas sp.]